MSFSPLDSGLTGPLFASAAMRAVFSDRARLAAMVRAEAGLATAQGNGALAAALGALDVGALDVAGIGRETGLAGVPSIPFVKAVQGLLPASLERGFHKGATTQDILDTALVLQCREALDLVGAALRGILVGLSRLAVLHRGTVCVGRSYGQHAAPVTFGFKVAVWLAGFSEVAARLPEVRGRLLVASLAGPVGILPQGPGVLEGFAAALGLGTTSIGWHVRRGRVAEAGGWLAQVIGTAAKMATDIADLASTEVGEVAEPYVPGRGGSSAMPHKRNPVSCTVILAAHGVAPGLAAGLLGGMAAAHERPAGAWHAEWHALPALFGLASGALQEALALAEGLEVDAGRMRSNIGMTRGMLFAEAVAGRLAPRMGREAAHALVERAAGAVRRGEGGLEEVLAAEGFGGEDVGAAFDLGPAVAAAGVWVDRAVLEAEDIIGELERDRRCP